MTILLRLLVLFGVLAAAAPVAAETYRLVAPDGTVTFTNIPTDPRHRRLDMAPPAPGPSRAPAFAPRTAAAPPVATPRIVPAVLTGGSYEALIREAAARYGVAETLIAAVIRVESAFNPRAVSSKGARGLMQLMPETATKLGVRDSFDPRENIDGGVRHLRAMLEVFGDVPLALAAYNAGVQAVQTYGGIPPFPETRDYVSRIMGMVDGIAGRGWASASTFRKFERDGTIVYTNIPPRL